METRVLLKSSMFWRFSSIQSLMAPKYIVSLLADLSPVHDQLRARDERGFIGGEECEGVGYLFYLAVPVQWDLGGIPADFFFRHSTLQRQVGEDEPGTDGVYANVVRRQFDRHRLGQ